MRDGVCRADYMDSSLYEVNEKNKHAITGLRI